MMCEDVLDASQNVFVVAPNDIYIIGSYYKQIQLHVTYAYRVYIIYVYICLLSYDTSTYSRSACLC